MNGLREYLQELEDLGHLVRIRRPVETRHEMAAVQWQVEKKLFQAVLFEQIVGHPGVTAAGNLFLMPLRTGVLPTVPLQPELASLYAGLRKPGIVYPVWATNPMFLGLYRELEATVTEALAHPIEPVAAGGRWEHSFVDREVDVPRLVPAPWYFREDAGHYLTTAVTIARDDATGYLNAGIYRIQLLDERRLAIMVNARRDLLSILYGASRQRRRLEVAIAVGLAPSLLAAATMSVPFGQSEFAVAGALQGAPYELAPGLTVDLPVPADAEFLIEGTIDPDERVREGPFTEYDLIASQATEGFCVNVTAVRRREAPVFHSLVCTSLEMVSLILPLNMTELAKIRRFVSLISPNVKDLFVLPGVPGTGLVVAVDKRSESEPLDLIRGLFAFSARLKRIVVVDTDVDIYDPQDVQWAVDTRVVATRDVAVLEATGELTDAARVGDFSVKTGIDATRKKGHGHRLTRSDTRWMEEVDVNAYLDAPVTA